MNDSTNKQAFNYFLKGDISGIQEFIFNVKSEGAAKSLKGRSFFIEALSLICVEKIKQELGKDNVEVFYNGGGNFYLDIKNFELAKLEQIKTDINELCKQYNFYIALAVVKKHSEEIKKTWESVNEAVEIAKLSKFQNFSEGYEAYDAPIKRKNGKDILAWKELVKFFKKDLPTYDFLPLKTYDFGVDSSGVKVFDIHLTKGNKPFISENIILRLPRWNDTIKALPEVQKLINQKEFNRTNLSKDELEEDKHITDNDALIEFSDLAHFAAIRTNTAKLGILKMDVDNLGEIFNNLQGHEDLMKKVSERFSDFFGKEMDALLQEAFSSEKIGPIRFIDNIYPVFAGGDDCFFVGSWDAILEWAKIVNQRFRLFAKEIYDHIHQNFDGVIEFNVLTKPPTISAGIVMLEPTYPVTRFSDLAEDALSAAKRFKYYGEDNAKKNKICLFDEVLTWQEFGTTLDTANQLKGLMTQPIKPEPRSTIEKIRITANGYKALHHQARQGKITRPAISRLFYFARNSPNQERINELIITPFAKELIGVFANHQQCNPLKYPMAARLAEFMTRK